MILENKNNKNEIMNMSDIERILNKDVRNQSIVVKNEQKAASVAFSTQRQKFLFNN
jgi:hypothetical protein